MGCRVAFMAHNHRGIVGWMRNVIVHLRLRRNNHRRAALIGIVGIWICIVIVVVGGVLRDVVCHLRHEHGEVVRLRWKHVLHGEMRHGRLRSRGKHRHLWHGHITVGWRRRRRHRRGDGGLREDGSRLKLHNRSIDRAGVAMDLIHTDRTTSMAWLRCNIVG